MVSTTRLLEYSVINLNTSSDKKNNDTIIYWNKEKRKVIIEFYIKDIFDFNVTYQYINKKDKYNWSVCDFENFEW